MKKLVEEVYGEGLESLLGEQVELFCMNYIYAGELVGVNDHDVKIRGAKIVYETGALVAKTWQDAQDLPSDWYVRTAAIESYGASGR